VLSSWAPQFRGFQQHDAQEMLLVLLNFLHEDLCDLKKSVNSSSSPSVASSSNASSLSVSPSPISGMFAGLYRSVLTCDDCGLENTLFEPFLNLSLPVPEKDNRKLPVCFVPLQGRPIKLGVRVAKVSKKRKK
jgi:ubiquitin C-terminal hydrolase